MKRFIFCPNCGRMLEIDMWNNSKTGCPDCGTLVTVTRMDIVNNKKIVRILCERDVVAKKKIMEV